MKVEDFINILGADFYTGVPDSQLKPLCNYLMNTYGIDGQHHIIAANEGNGVALAAGYHLATGRVPVVYMQNSGEGNIINPVASLLSDKVYAIPMIFVIGWRGEPGVKDEPQHVYQGQVTRQLLDVMDIQSYVITEETTMDELVGAMQGYRDELRKGKDVAFVVAKGALSYDGEVVYRNGNTMKREDIIRQIVAAAGDDFIVCTTGKASRELFEIREARGEGHGHDFLTVGSMGHSSSIALGLALHSQRRIWCIDGDGAALMHMGAMAVIGAQRPRNLTHVLINNGAHETVGGMPTVAGSIDLPDIARACGYSAVYSAKDAAELATALQSASSTAGPVFLEAKSSIGARADLGRPTTSPQENKAAFMERLRE